jgi:integrase
MAFGKYPDVPLAEARKRHANARQLLANGVDPMALRKEVKEQKKVKQIEAMVKQPKGHTFETLARKWFAWWKTDKNARYARNVETRLEGDIIAKVGTKIPEEITRMDLVALIKAVDARGARDIAKRNLQFVRQIYDFGMDNGLLDQNTLNPAAGIKPGADSDQGGRRTLRQPSDRGSARVAAPDARLQRHRTYPTGDGFVESDIP